MKKQSTILHHLYFLAGAFFCLYIPLTYLFITTLPSTSLFLICGHSILLFSGLIYWPVIMFGSLPLAWSLWLIYTIIVLAIAFPLELNFLYWHIPIHIFFIQAIALIKRERSHIETHYNIAIQEKLETCNELHKYTQKQTLLIGSLKDLIQRYALLNTLLNAINATLQESEMITIALTHTQRIIGKGERVLFYSDTPDNPHITLRKTVPVDQSNEQHDLFNQWVLKHHLPLLVTDVSKDFRFQNFSSPSSSFQSLIISPLINDQRCVGFIRVESSSANIFNTNDLRLLNILSHLTTKAIINARLYSKTLELSIKDDLTGLYVRRYFSDRCEEEIQKSFSQHTCFSLALIDIDHFKKYNDTYGHIAGDKVLTHMATELHHILPEHSTIARYGGEEFAILLPLYNKSEAYRQLNALREHIANQSILLRKQPTYITISCGIATFGEDALTQHDLLALADKRLYQAKTDGRNRICYL